jgi:peptide deformylase
MDKKIKEYIQQHYKIQTGLNNPILRKKSEPVDNIQDPEIQDFAQILFYAMEIYDGI